MLKIRLTRVGKKHDPLYRIVVTEHTNPVKGKFLEIIGNYSPKTKALVLDETKALEWMNKGAKPSNTVAKFLELKKVKHNSVVVQKFNKKAKHTEAPTQGSESRSESIGKTEVPSTETPETVSTEQTETIEAVETPSEPKISESDGTKSETVEN